MADGSLNPLTVTFCKQNGLDLLVDVYVPSAETKPTYPVLLMLHGGGFMAGDKSSQPPLIIKHFVDDGYIVISPNYPLAPQSSVFSQLDALLAAWDWIHAPHHADRSLVSLVPAAERCQAAVWGGSAGASLLIFAAGRMQPSPKATVLLYPFVDLVRPDRMGTLQDIGSDSLEPGFWDPLKLKQTIKSVESSPIVQGSLYDEFPGLLTWEAGQPRRRITDPNTAYLFSVAALEDHTAFASAVLGFDYADERPEQTALKDQADAFKLARDVACKPLLIIQGVNDGLTPLQNTLEWAAAVEKASRETKESENAKSQVEVIETDACGGRHGFDFSLVDASSPEFEQTIGRAKVFLDLHVRDVDKRRD